MIWFVTFATVYSTTNFSEMKKTLLFFTLFTAFAAFGQTEKGSFIFNLDGFLQQSSYSKYNSYYGRTNLKLGYAFLDNLFLGVQYAPSYGVNVDKKVTFQIPKYGMFTRYYFLKNRNRIYLQSDFIHTNDSAFGWNDKWNVGVGFSHFISKNVALEAYFDYNFYNREVTYWKSNTPFEGGVSIINTNNPTGGIFNFGLNFFLPHTPAGIEKEARQPLVERYLKKDNQSIALEGNLDFDLPDFILTLNVEKSRFLTDRIKLQHHLFTETQTNKGYGYSTLTAYRVGVAPYFSISHRLYFTPSIGLGPGVLAFQPLELKDFGLSFEAKLGLTQFFKSWKVELGASASALQYKRKYGEDALVYFAYLNPEIFITEKLAIKPSFYYNLRKERAYLLKFDNYRLVEVDDFRLQFGISYYY